MKTHKLVLLVVGVLSAVPAFTAAQKIESGKWTGTLTPPDGPQLDVTYDVKAAGDTIAITMNTNQFGSYVFHNARVNGGKLTFNWSPGAGQLTCELEQRGDGAWAGNCTDGDQPGQIVMVPPRKG